MYKRVIKKDGGPYKKRRYYWGWRYYKKKTPAISRAPAYGADEFRTQLHWTHFCGVSEPTTNIVTFLFRGNGMHDPDISTGGTSQPAGYDQLFAYYQRVLVTSAVMEVEMVGSDDTPQGFFYAIMAYDAATTLPSNLTSSDVFSANPYTKHGVVSYLGGPGREKIIAGTKAIYGVKELDDTYEHESGGQPANAWNFAIRLNGVSGTGIHAKLRVKITYNARFRGIKPLSLS